MSELSLHDLPSGTQRRRDQRDRRTRRRRRRRRAAVVLVICLAVFGGGAYAVYEFVRPIYVELTAAKDYEGQGTGSVEVVIEPGASGRAIGSTLEGADVVKTAGAFVDVVEGDPRLNQIQPGTYRLRSQMSASAALELLLDPAARVSFRVVVPEGFNAAQVFGRLAEETGIAATEFEAAAADPAIGLPPEAGGNVEGYLFPATYDFEPDSTPVAMLTAMVSRSLQAMESVGVPAARRTEVLTKASLVEEEARKPEDFGKVARVIENRLAAGMPLQFDSTVNFATGKEGITTTDADRAIDSPYNTYQVEGLPPGPISSPGEAAMEAVLNPTPGDWLFFVAVNPETGETRFAVTAEEHAANVELFRQWLAENG